MFLIMLHFPSTAQQIVGRFQDTRFLSQWFKNLRFQHQQHGQCEYFCQIWRDILQCLYIAPHAAFIRAWRESGLTKSIISNILQWNREEDVFLLIAFERISLSYFSFFFPFLIALRFQFRPAPSSQVNGISCNCWQLTTCTLGRASKLCPTILRNVIGDISPLKTPSTFSQFRFGHQRHPVPLSLSCNIMFTFRNRFAPTENSGGKSSVTVCFLLFFPFRFRLFFFCVQQDSVDVVPAASNFSRVNIS